MRAVASVSVHNDFTASQACISVWAAFDEVLRWVNVENSFVVDVLFRNYLFDLFNQDTLDFVKFDIRVVLLRNQNSVSAHRDELSVDVVLLEGHLTLGVGAQPLYFSGLALVGQCLHDLVREHEGDRHQLGSFVGCVAEHGALVSCSEFVALFAFVHSVGDVRTLLVDAHLELQSRRVHAFVDVVVPDLLDLLTHDFFLVYLGFGGDFAEEHQLVVFHASLACNH